MRVRAFALLAVFAASAVVAAAEPAATRILVQNSPVAGFQFHEGKRVWAQMQVGDELALVREPGNAYDPRAVRVDWNGHKLGYVPRAQNEAVARQLDRGNRLEARIVRLNKSRDPWKRVEFEVFLRL